MNELRALIVDRIRATGPISFAEFMDLALYHPSLGYYARAVRRTGRSGDFFTSVDVGPIFGELLARQLAEMWRLLSRNPGAGADTFDLVEAGAGNGQLSADILEAASRQDPEFYEAVRLHLVERSEAARAAQPATLGIHAGHLVSSAAALPHRIHGAVLANELLDALPTHVVAMTQHGLREVLVGAVGDRLVETLSEPSTGEIERYLARAGVTPRPGWRCEVNLEAVEWIRSAARRLERGFLLIVDYGYEAGRLYSAPSGTLMTFRDHVADVPGHGVGVQACLAEPGESDITAHVDLTSATLAAEAGGLTTVARLDQSYFLIGLAESGAAAAVFSNRKHVQAFKTLALPGGLGSTHKVLIFGKGVGRPRLSGCSFSTRLT
jgi:SAM-dependent MidA family methyltransferase